MIRGTEITLEGTKASAERKLPSMFAVKWRDGTKYLFIRHEPTDKLHTVSFSYSDTGACLIGASYTDRELVELMDDGTITMIDSKLTIG